jgi:hypothetical protein
MRPIFRQLETCLKLVSMPERFQLTAEPTLPEAVKEALDTLKVASSANIADWLKEHRPNVWQREASAALVRTICELRNGRNPA